VYKFYAIKGDDGTVRFRADNDGGNALLRYLEIVQAGGKDYDLLILRSHLMMEDLLLTLVAARYKDPERFKKGRPGFARLLNLAKLRYRIRGGEWLWESLRLLNTVRNQTAHVIESRFREENHIKLDRLDELVGKHSGVPMPKKLADRRNIHRLQWRLASLYSVLYRLHEKTRHIEPSH
jgi:hypothetical protein